METYTCSTVGGYGFGREIKVVCENKAAAKYVIKRYLRTNGIANGGELQDCEIKEIQDDGSAVSNE